LRVHARWCEFALCRIGFEPWRVTTRFRHFVSRQRKSQACGAAVAAGGATALIASRGVVVRPALYFLVGF
jgi:hypothetical protein